MVAKGFIADSKTKRAFLMGADMWQKYSCINFVHNPYAKDRVKIEYGQGCWSNLGKTGGEQKISLGEGCDVGPIAAHEIGHTIGFWHTMARYDRDQFITLNLRNIKESWLSQFAKQTPKTNDNFNLTYDYGSIMHYGGRSAGIDRRNPTMVPFNTDYQETLGSHFMSFIDLSMINELYGCKKSCVGKRSANCKMGGFPNPRDCSKCVCPGGYAGDQCTERPDEGCGSKIDATEKTLTDVLGDYSVRQPLEDFKKCNYWIESPKGTEIIVEIVSLKGHQAVDGCVFTGVEIKTNKNQQLTGFSSTITCKAYNYYKVPNCSNQNHYMYQEGPTKSPKGTEIIVEIVSLKGHQAVDGCVFTGVEIKTNKNQQLTGFSSTITCKAYNYYKVSNCSNQNHYMYQEGPSKLFGIEAYLKSLNAIAKAKNIDVRTRHNLIEVDTNKKIAKFELLDENCVPNGEVSEIPMSLFWRKLVEWR
nr:Peptidase M12A domain containing protein [Haemonchus contortus]